MRGRSTLLLAAASFALGAPSWAEAPEEFERGEKLAWHIEAYTPCDHGDGIGAIKEEVSTFEATRDEMLIALDIIEHDENACANLKTTSGKLLLLAQNEPEKFDLAFGFQDQLVADVSVPEPAAKVKETLATGKKEAKNLTPPPQASAIKARSSY